MRRSASHQAGPQRARFRCAGSAATATLAPVTALLVLRGLFGVASRSWPAAASSPAPVTADEVVLGLMAWAAVALCAWLSIGITLTAATALPGRLGRAFEGLTRVVTPAVVRRSLAMALGVSVSTLALPAGQASGTTSATQNAAPRAATDSGAIGQGETDGAGRPLQPGLAPTSSSSAASVTAPAWHPTGRGADDRHRGQGGPSRDTTAMSGSNHPVSVPVAVPQLGPGLHATHPSPSTSNEYGHDHDLGPGWRPTAPLRVVTEQPTLLTPVLRPDCASLDHVTVRRGDTLWSIAAHHLGPSATDAEIAHEWPRWYAANLRLIGADPDLIHPGQQLLPPDQKVLR